MHHTHDWDHIFLCIIYVFTQLLFLLCPNSHFTLRMRPNSYMSCAPTQIFSWPHTTHSQFVFDPALIFLSRAHNDYSFSPLLREALSRTSGGYHSLSEGQHNNMLIRQIVSPSPREGQHITCVLTKWGGRPLISASNEHHECLLHMSIHTTRA